MKWMHEKGKLERDRASAAGSLRHISLRDVVFFPAYTP